MTIQEKTRQALLELFPDQESEAAASIAPDPEAQTDEPAETGPRPNGIVERQYRVHGYHLDLQCGPDQLIRAVEILFELGYFLETITGVDWIKDGELEAVYDFSRYDFELCRTVIRIRIDRETPRLPTITSIYTGANWHERETHEFFGIVFEGHPHLVPLLLPEDADFHPLLKDFKA